MSDYCKKCKNKGAKCCTCVAELKGERLSIPSYYEPKEDIKYYNKHLKGYIFDSLVFRYKDVRDKLAMYEVQRYMEEKNCSRLEAEKKSMQRAQDDLMRFIRVLDEGIGEHD